MPRAILPVGVWGCLWLGLLMAAVEKPLPASGARTTKSSFQSQRETQRATRLLPTQVLWSRSSNQFVAIESGTRRVTELGAQTARVGGNLTGPVDVLTNGFAAVAPSGEWTARVDPRLPIVWFHKGDLLQPAPRPPTSVRVPEYVVIAPNPQALAITPDSKKVLVACDTTGPADRRVAIIDVETGTVSYRVIRGSSNLRGIAVDPHGKYVLAVHLVHKSHLPSTQIEQGWVFTNAITWLSLEAPENTITLPLDLRTQGFANPEGVAIAPDAATAYVAHAGANLVSVIDLAAMRAVVTELAGREDSPGRYQADDLRLTRRYVRTRIAVGSNPRGICISPDGKTLAVANRLDDSVSLIDTGAESVIATISLRRGGEPALAGEDALIREGERLFHSGKLSYSGQFSCASCHPDGHSDGLNWDLPADGFNNFFNTKSLRGNALTAPYGWAGTSLTLPDRFTGTLRHLFQHEPTADETRALESYLAALPHAALPGLPLKEQAAAIARGKSLFEGAAGCIGCHRGEKFTDRALHDVGTGSDGQTSFDTPTLLRIATTAPYLHDGRAATLEEIFAKNNLSGLHGQGAELTPEQLSDLIEYLKSL